MSTYSLRIFQLRDTAIQLAATNVIPVSGRLCKETDTGKWKVGDGTTAYRSLPYVILEGEEGRNADTSFATMEGSDDRDETGGGGGDVTQQYVDDGDASTLSSAEGYTDSASSSLQTYADGKDTNRRANFARFKCDIAVPDDTVLTTLAAGQVVQGVTMVSGQTRILLFGTNSLTAGPYISGPGAAARDDGFGEGGASNAHNEIAGSRFPVSQGTYAGSVFECTTRVIAGGGTLGTDALEFRLIYGGSYVYRANISQINDTVAPTEDRVFDNTFPFPLEWVYNDEGYFWLQRVGGGVTGDFEPEDIQAFPTHDVNGQNIQVTCQSSYLQIQTSSGNGALSKTPIYVTKFL